MRESIGTQWKRKCRRWLKVMLLVGPALCLPLACPRPPELDLTVDCVFKLDKDRNIVFAALRPGAEQPADFQTLVKPVKNLAEPERYEVLAVVPAGAKELLLITRQHGLLSTKDLGGNWQRIDAGLPPEVVYPFRDHGLTKPIMSLSISRDKMRIAVLFPESLFLSRDGGHTFAEAPLEGAATNVEYLCVAWHPDNENLLMVGTAQLGSKINNGVYVSKNGGGSIFGIYGGLPGEPTARPNYFEIVTALCFGENADTIYAGLGNGGGVYRGSLAARSFHKLDAPELYTYPDGDFYQVSALACRAGALFITTNRPWKKIIPIGAAAESAAEKTFRDFFLTMDNVISLQAASGDCLSFAPSYLPKRGFAPDPRALGKKGLYISYAWTQGDNYPKLIGLLERLKLNAVIVNVKDDYGYLRVPSDDPLLRQAGAVDPYVKMKETIARLKADGIYFIGRLVVFKDDLIYDFDKHKYAVKTVSGRPLTKGPEKWVDPFREFVWDYNIAAAQAVAEAGADEIQFDYIRLPDLKGDSFGNARYDFRKKNQLSREALTSFLKKAREKLTVPISVDVFGYQAVYKFGRWIGQDITEMAAHVDAVSPMFYPSHYSGGYAINYGDKRIYYTIYLSCKRALELIGGAHLRPYIQAFYYRENEDNYGVDYIGWELDGLKNSGAEDYIFWNDLSEHIILVKGMRKYLGDKTLPSSVEIKAQLPKKIPFSKLLENP